MMTQKLNKTYHELDKKYYLQTFKRYPLTFDHGKGPVPFQVSGALTWIDELQSLNILVN